MTIALAGLVDYADSLLSTPEIPDYAGAFNGLQLECRSPIKRVVAAVDFSTRAIEGAISEGANLLLVHHGMFWQASQAIKGARYRRLRLLLDNDIAVYASHLPLDLHASLGNNVLLAKELGLQPSGVFARHESFFIGVSGKADIDTRDLVDRARAFSEREGGTIRCTRIAKGQRTRVWGMCTGAGASADTIAEAIEGGIDTLIVGEGPHWTAVAAEEENLTIIYAGHYATETLGVRALAEHLGSKFGLPWGFVSAPTGL